MKKTQIYDDTLRRLERQAVRLDASGNGQGQFDNEGAMVDPVSKVARKLPRWRVDPKWIEFECGCRAEWVDRVIDPKNWDPIIRGFRNAEGIEQLAVYDFVCHAHNASMNVRLMRHYVDFAQWRRERRRKLLGR